MASSSSECMLDKSKENSEAAYLLLKGGKYNASVHCSYYSVFQYLICVEPTLFEISSSGKGSHDSVINHFKKTVQKEARVKYAMFKKSVYKLKKSRKTADYESEHISKDMCESCYHEIVCIKEIIDKIYNN